MSGTSEAHAAFDADLPPVSLVPWIRLRLVAPRRTILSDLPGWCLRIPKVPPEGVMAGGTLPAPSAGSRTPSRGAWAGGARLPGDVEGAVFVHGQSIKYCRRR